MSDRNAILDAIRRNRPAPTPAPEVPSFDRPDDDLPALFREAVAQVGGEAHSIEPAHLAATLLDAFPDAEQIASTVAGLFPDALRPDDHTDPAVLAGVELFVCRAVLGVAENGAVWVPASAMGHRAAPFLAQHMAVLLDQDALVWNLHEAYARLDVADEGFGAFIAGPSKTADIEQALVIGAHGPRSLHVFLERKKGPPG